MRPLWSHSSLITSICNLLKSMESKAKVYYLRENLIGLTNILNWIDGGILVIRSRKLIPFKETLRNLTSKVWLKRKNKREKEKRNRELGTKIKALTSIKAKTVYLYSKLFHTEKIICLKLNDVMYSHHCVHLYISTSERHLSPNLVV